jgi:hypothetical protein
MKIPACFVAVLLLLAAMSCKKDSGPSLLDTPATYHKTSKSPTGSSRIFTRAGEIKTASIINRFENFDNNWLDALGDGLYPQAGRVDSIRVYDAKRIDVNNFLRYESYDVAAKGNNITLTAKDTSSDVSYHEVYTRSIYYYIALHKPPVFREYLVTSTAGLYGFGYTTLEQFHLETEGVGFKLPWITGVIHYANGATNSLSIQNRINVNFYKSLAAGDTVIIREYAVYYKK